MLVDVLVCGHCRLGAMDVLVEYSYTCQHDEPFSRLSFFCTRCFLAPSLPTRLPSRLLFSVSSVTSDRFHVSPAFLDDYRHARTTGASLARQMTKIVSAGELLFADVSSVLLSQRAHPPRSSKTPRVSASFCAGSIRDPLRRSSV